MTIADLMRKGATALDDLDGYDADVPTDLWLTVTFTVQVSEDGTISMGLVGAREAE